MLMGHTVDQFKLQVSLHYRSVSLYSRADLLLKGLTQQLAQTFTI